MFLQKLRKNLQAECPLCPAPRAAASASSTAEGCRYGLFCGARAALPVQNVFRDSADAVSFFLLLFCGKKSPFPCSLPHFFREKPCTEHGRTDGSPHLLPQRRPFRDSADAAVFFSCYFRMFLQKLRKNLPANCPLCPAPRAAASARPTAGSHRRGLFCGTRAALPVQNIFRDSADAVSFFLLLFCEIKSPFPCSLPHFFREKPCTEHGRTDGSPHFLPQRRPFRDSADRSVAGTFQRRTGHTAGSTGQKPLVRHKSRCGTRLLRQPHPMTIRDSADTPHTRRQNFGTAGTFFGTAGTSFGIAGTPFRDSRDNLRDSRDAFGTARTLFRDSRDIFSGQHGLDVH